MRLIFLSTLLVISQLLFANIKSDRTIQTVELTDMGESVKVGKNLWIWKDSSNSKDISYVMNKAKFIKTVKEVPNLDVSSNTFWFKFIIKNSSKQSNLVLSIDYPLLDLVELHEIGEEESKVYRSGFNESIADRPYRHQNFLFDIDLEDGETKTYYLKVQCEELTLVPIRVSNTKVATENLLTQDTLSGIYFGVMLALFFYNLFLFFTVRDKSYLYYVFVILTIGLAQVSLQGYTYRFLTPSSPVFSNLSIFLFSSLGGIFSILFARDFLQTKHFFPRLDKVFFVLYATYGINAIVSLTGNNSLSYKLVDMNGGLTAFFMLFIAIKIALKGYRPAKVFLFAWGLLLFGVVIFVLRNTGILPYTTFTNNSVQIGGALEAVFLSIALADKINILKREKEENQAKILEALRENERIIKEQNVILEFKVRERTKELERSNQELKDTQAQLVSSEKMASLGQLTAGIAHEINNPINFVSSNVLPLKRDIDDLLTVFDAYEGIKKEEDFEQKIKEINSLKEDLEIDYIKNEMNELLNGIKEGAERTAEIVKGLKNFSRLDESDLKSADLNEGLESTLTILNSKLKTGIEIEKSYGEIPEIECFAGKVNQLFLNILNNALDAVISDSKPDKKISLITSHDENHVFVSIKDNGVGMTQETISKLYEPFFTTKDVGKGIGLGMSIVYQIVESHKGSIEIKSEVGQGSEFIITFPRHVEAQN